MSCIVYVQNGFLDILCIFSDIFPDCFRYISYTSCEVIMDPTDPTDPSGKDKDGGKDGGMGAIAGSQRVPKKEQ